jgi:hypothetical protein
VWCEIPLQKKDKLLVGTFYRLPNSDIANNAAVNELLSGVSVGRSHVLICGDLNYLDIDWLEGFLPRDGGHPASKFMEAVKDLFLVQHIKKPTHNKAEQTPHVLDLNFTSEEAMIRDVRHQAPLGKSHHQFLLFGVKYYTDQ